MKGHRSVLLALLLGCGGAAPPPRAVAVATDAGAPKEVIPMPSDVDPSVPADLRTDVARAQKIGKLLASFDSAAARGTDALLASKPAEPIRGYVVYPNEDATGWEVPFFTVDPLAVVWRATVPRGGRATVVHLDPPVTPTPREAALFRARQEVIAAVRAAGPITQAINPVVFPANLVGEEGLLVYLLAGTTAPGVLVLGKHWRARTSLDGTKVTELEPMSRGPIELSPPQLPEGAKPAGFVVTHLVSPAPLESHVFASLQQQQPIFVATERGNWKVEAGAISFMGARQ